MKKSPKNPLTIDFQSFGPGDEVKIDVIHIPETHEDFLEIKKSLEKPEEKER